MNDHDPFIAAVVADIDSDLPRLRYADFLDEIGDEASTERAEFVRVQCALETMEDTDPQFAPLHRREKQLLEENWREWMRPVCKSLNEAVPLKPLPAPPPRRSWFGLRLSRAEVPEPAEEQYSLQILRSPTRRLHRVSQDASFNPTVFSEIDARAQGDRERLFFAGLMSHLGPRARPYLQSARFGRGFVDEIVLNLNRQRPLTFLDRTLASNPVTSLVLNQFVPDDVNYLIQKRHLVRLRQLGLEECGEVSVRYLTQTPDSNFLRRLSFRRTDPECLETIFVADHFERLTRLDLRDCRLRDEQLRWLADSPILTRLTRLVIAQAEECDDGLRSLAGSPGAGNLERVDLRLPISSPELREELRQRFPFVRLLEGEPADLDS